MPKNQTWTDGQPNRAWGCPFWEPRVDRPPIAQVQDWLGTSTVCCSDRYLNGTPPACCTVHLFCRGYNHLQTYGVQMSDSTRLEGGVYESPALILHPMSKQKNQLRTFLAHYSDQCWHDAPLTCWIAHSMYEQADLSILQRVQPLENLVCADEWRLLNGYSNIPILVTWLSFNPLRLTRQKLSWQRCIWTVKHALLCVDKLNSDLEYLPFPTFCRGNV